MDSKFVDRKDIQKGIINDITIYEEKNKILILSAGQGIGKTALTKKISSKLDSHTIFRVKTNFFSKKGVPEGAYYKAFVRCAVKLRESGLLPSFIDYLKDKPKDALSSIAIGLVKAVSKFDPIASKLINFSENISKITDKDLGNLIYSRNPEIQINFSSYIISAIRDKKVLIVIENSHCLDEEFIEFSKQLLRNSKGIYFIFEYTTNVESKVLEQDIFNTYEDENVSIESLLLDKLSSNYALQIVCSKDKNSLEVIKKYYEESDGNLKPLQQMANYRAATLSNTLRSMSESKHGIEAVTINEFENLSDNEKYVLSIISTADGLVSFNELKEVLEGDTIFENFHSLRIIIDNLIASEFIEIESDHIFLKDDVSYRKIGGERYLGRYEQLALVSWKKYYNSLDDLRCYNAPEEHFLKKLRIAISLNDKSEILILSEEAIKHASQSNSPWLYLRPIIDWSINERESDSWYEFINRILVAAINFGEYKSASSIIDRIKNTQWYNEGDRLKLALVLLKLGRPQCCIDELKLDSFNEIKNNIKACVLKLTAYYYLSDFEKAYLTYKEIYSFAGQEHTVEAGHVLSCSSLFNRYSEATKDLRKAVEIFDMNSADISAARARNKLAIDLARLGCLEEAFRLLKESSNYLRLKKIDRSIMVNNLEAISLQEGVVKKDLFVNLNDVLVTAQGIYEKVIICNNLMLAATLVKDLKLAELHATEVLNILNSGVFLDQGIYWTIKKNMKFTEDNLDIRGCRFSSRVPDFKLSSIPKHKICSYIDADLISSIPTEDVFFANMKYRPMYLSHWTIEF